MSQQLGPQAETTDVVATLTLLEKHLLLELLSYEGLRLGKNIEGFSGPAIDALKRRIDDCERLINKLEGMAE